MAASCHANAGQLGRLERFTGLTPDAMTLSPTSLGCEGPPWRREMRGRNGSRWQSFEWPHRRSRLGRVEKQAKCWPSTRVVPIGQANPACAVTWCE